MGDAPRLSRKAFDAIRAPGNEVSVSAASMLEVALKRTLDRLTVPDDFVEQVRVRRFDELAVTWEHAWRAGSLPFHHRDPFDRLLVAQAQAERMTLVTRDARIVRYDVAILAA